MMMFTLRSVLGGLVAAGVIGAGAGFARPARADTVFSFNFESPDFVAGLLAGQQGWTGAASVQTGIVNATGGGARSMQLPAGSSLRLASRSVNVSTAGGGGAQVLTLAADYLRLGGPGVQGGMAIFGGNFTIVQIVGDSGLLKLGSFNASNPTVPAADGAWHHLVMVIDFGTNTLSGTVDGTSLGSLPITNSPIPTVVTQVSAYIFGAPVGAGVYVDNLSLTTSRLANDACGFAQAAGLGATAFNTTTATTDGPAHSGCDTGAVAPIVNDVWYTHVPASTGVLTASTCGSSFDTKIEVYQGTSCPPIPGNLLACNDDNVACGAGGVGASVQSQVTVNVTAGTAYLIRVGGSPAGNSSGAGTLTLSLATTGACCNRWTGHCMLRTSTDCTGQGLRFDGYGAACTPAGCRACPADFNGADGTTISDIFDFLSAWFVGCG